MRGTTHALIGAAVPLGAAAHDVGPAQCAAMAVISAGFALGPDIDHPRSTISRALPRQVHKGALWLSARARTIATGKDRRSFAGRASIGHAVDHRALTHTGVCAIAIGVAAGIWSLFPFGAVIITVLAALVSKGLIPRKFRRWVYPGVVAAGGLAWLADLDPWMAGLAAGLGWLSHVVADGCTTFGVPLMWPVMVHGKRWWRFRFMGSRLESGDPKEWWVGSGVAVIFIGVPCIF
ncbi:metal-dependent hydrolase [Streptomyces sp. 5-10]|uniref:metal-dependent hydrolase n=1 Tax=Streptomyces sp. 5-10 TaxID=878925 RepID=UPI00168BC5A1|nr:metal-dependent hydrolase [Streptomyces sp. 5-10]MBD3004859.1 metal-dependent hydrolase [Streptomyces sp. 5-10]